MTRSGNPETRVDVKSRETGKKEKAFLREVEELRTRLEEAEATIEAIRSGAVDALIVSGPEGERVFALEVADHPYRVIVEVMNEGVVTLGSDGSILSCNSHFTKVVKTPIERVLGKPFAQFVDTGDLPMVSSFLTKAARESCSRTITLALPDKTSLPVNLSAGAFEVGQSSALCVVVTDLTAVAAATKTRLWLASIVDTSNDAVISKSLEGTILTWNAAAERIYGFSAQEAIGQPISIIVPNDRIHEVAEIAEKIRLRHRIQAYETVRITKSGTLIDVSLTISPQKGGEVVEDAAKDAQSN